MVLSANNDFALARRCAVNLKQLTQIR